jgi:CDP-diacylglycerol--glycerol-3-phosphate 3-phosphatidyltransferase
MRGFYGVAKAVGFVFLAGLTGYQAGTASWLDATYDVAALRWLGWGFVWSAVALTVIRGIPVVVDALAYLERAPTPAPAAKGAKAVNAVDAAPNREVGT